MSKKSSYLRRAQRMNVDPRTGIKFRKGQKRNDEDSKKLQIILVEDNSANKCKLTRTKTIYHWKHE